MIRRKNPLFENLFLRFGDTLGDLINSNGLTHYFAEKARYTYIQCRDPKYFPSIECLYKDFPNITVITQEQFNAEAGIIPNSYKIDGIPCGPLPLYFNNGEAGAIDVAWERMVYENFDVPFSVRYKMFKLPNHVEGAQELKDKLTEGEQDYIVVNRYFGGELNQSDYLVDMWNTEGYKVIEITPDITNNVFQYIELFKHAKQIHVVPTSIHQLVDSMLHLIAGDVFIHLVRRNFFSPVNCQFNEYRWKQIMYHHQW